MPRRMMVLVAALLALGVPTLIQGEILHLKDGSAIRGKVVSFAGDTLVFAPSFGGRISVHRGEIVRLVFDESTDTGPAPASKAATDEGPGTVSVVFEKNKVASKIVVTNKTRADEDKLERANWIEQVFVVGSDTVFARVDTTLDKTIYKGHEKELKNTMELEDVQVTMAPGVYRCVLIVRNLGASEYESEFTEGPLDMELEFKTVGVYPAQMTTLRVGINKGFLRMGSPRLVPAD